MLPGAIIGALRANDHKNTTNLTIIPDKQIYNKPTQTDKVICRGRFAPKLLNPNHLHFGHLFRHTFLRTDTDGRRGCFAPKKP